MCVDYVHSDIDYKKDPESISNQAKINQQLTKYQQKINQHQFWSSLERLLKLKSMDDVGRHHKETKMTPFWQPKTDLKVIQNRV